jgi:uncharacterized repeat protein (TIGR03803 family)
MSTLSFLKRIGSIPVAAAALLAGLLGAAAPAAAYSIIHSHHPDPGNPSASLIADGAGNVYGTTENGGLSNGGIAFRIKTDGTGFQILHAFGAGSGDGRTPRAPLILAGSGDLYGTTVDGGSSDLGTIFKIKTDGTGFQVLYSFTGGESDGANPSASLILDSGNIYGTTVYGGLSNAGTVFQVRVDGVGLPLLHSFAGGVSDGQFPYAPLILDDSGNFYGTTSSGGASGRGTIFTIKTSGADFRLLRSFAGGAGDGSGPRAALILDGSGNLFGTTLAGGPSDAGSVFKVKTDGTGFQILRAFAGGASDGDSPYAPLILDSSDNLYGTTQGASSSSGTVFRVKTDGTGFQVLRLFTGGGSDGAQPFAAVILAGPGQLYGTTYSGGPLSQGTVFSIDTDGNGFRLLHAFIGDVSDGKNPHGSLVRDGSGNLYGTTYSGGSSDLGTVFKVKTDGTGFELLYSFLGRPNDGSQPLAALVLDGSGNLYGTTTFGGSPSDAGSVFKVKTDGTGFQILHAFTGSASDGSNPAAALILDGSGNLYGTTVNGGSSNFGSVFKVRTDGTGFQILHLFAGANDGANSSASLILDGPGDLYGTTVNGGGSSMGTVFNVKTDGTGFRVLYSFAGGPDDGANPSASLILNGSGNLYGTTQAGGLSNAGTVFKVKTDGTGLQLLHSFAGGASDGSSPVASLVLDGPNLYGTTLAGGSSDRGTVFTLKADGAGFQLLHTFTRFPNDGKGPASLILDGSGNLFGTTYLGGTSDWGAEFTLAALCLPPPAPTVALISGTNPTCAGSSVTLDAGAGYASYLWSTGATTRTILVSPSTTTPYFVQVAAPGCAGLSPAGSLTVTVTPNPPSPSPTNDGPKCEGGTVQLTAGVIAGATYAWTGPNGFTSSAMLPTLSNVTPAMAGDYFVTIMAGGCVSAAGKTTVAVIAKPATPVLTVPSFATPAQTFAASVSPAAGTTYQWTVTGNGTLASGQGSASVTVTAGAVGTLTVKVTGTNAFGCVSSEASSQVIVADPVKLLLQRGRVSAEVTWTSQYSGQTGVAFALPQKDDFGSFYFTDPDNREVFVKVLDFGSGGALCFVGGLTDLYYKLVFTTIATGQTLVFEKPAGQYLGFADNGTLKFGRRISPGATGSRGTGDGGGVFAGVLPLADQPRDEARDEARTSEADAAPQSLTLSMSRVSVVVEWKSQYSGAGGVAYAIPQNDDFGFFSFTDPGDPEVIVKVLDFGSGGALCFVGGLTDFSYKVTFTVLRTGQTLVFEKPAGQYVGFADNGTLRF